MELEEILQLDRRPFDSLTEGWGQDREAEESFLEEEAHFVLFLRYMALFISQCGYHFPVPLRNCYISKRKDQMLCHSDGTGRDIQPRSQTMTAFFREIMGHCGWSVRSLRLTEEGQIPQFSQEEMSDFHEWERIFSYMPGFLTLKDQGYWNITVTVCWSHELYDYYDFYNNNENLVREQFSDAAEVIARILRKTADPYALGMELEPSCYKDRKYFMGFFEASHIETTVSILDMDYNFMVQILILHMLVQCAESRFGYRQKGGAVGSVETV